MSSWLREIQSLPAMLLAIACMIPVSRTAADDQPPAVPLPQRISPLLGLQLQEGDEPLEAFRPRTPASDADRQRSEAIAHYMAGRIRQENRQLNQALQAYLKAVELDPRALDPYQAAIPILLQQGNLERARELALAAGQKADNGISLVLTMAAIFARQDQLGEGTKLLKQALNISRLQDRSAEKLSLHRDLGLYYRLGDQISEAAEQYKIVFEAVLDESLDDEVRKTVLQDPGKNFDEFGDVFLKAQQPELALRAFEEASKHRDEKPGLHSFNLATVFQQTGNPQKALDELQGYFDAQFQTRGRAAYDLLKDLLEELDRSEELIPRLEKIFAEDKHNEVLRFYLADVHLDAGDIERAEVLYRNDRETVSDPRALVGMLAIHRRRNEPEKLLTVLTNTFQAVPRADDERVLQQLAPDVRDLSERFEAELKALLEDKEASEALFEHARTLTTGDDPKLEFFQAYVLGKLATEGEYTDQALTFYRFAISLRNDPPALLFNELGRHLLDAQRYEEAIAVFTEAVNHPSNGLQRDRWMFLFFLSYAHEFQGETEKALEAVREAQQLNPSFARLHYQEAWIVYHSRQWDEALRLFEKVMRDFPNEKDLIQDIRFRVSNIYVEKGDMAKGEAVLEEVLAADPESSQANNDLGYLWADQGKNLDQAKTMIEKALAAEPDNPAYQDSMGWVLYKLERYEEALPYLEKASRHKHGQDGTIFDHLGDCLLKLGRTEEAKANWQKALQLELEKKGPNEKLVKSLREKLGKDD